MGSRKSTMKSTTSVKTTPVTPELQSYQTSLNNTGYITKAALLSKLVEVFACEGLKPDDFKIVVRIFSTPRSTPPTDAKKIVACLDIADQERTLEVLGAERAY
jgi:hypothetical protein